MCHVQILRYYARKYNFAIPYTRTAFWDLCKSNFLLPSNSLLAFWKIFASRWYVVTCINFYVLDWQSGHSRSFSWFYETKMYEKISLLVHRYYNCTSLFSSSLLEHPVCSKLFTNFPRLSLYFSRKLMKCLCANDVYT